jgi:hypothetical protein
MQVIQGSVARADFAKTMAQMREWLDRNDCRLAGFETAADDIGTITVKASFDGNDVADAFCRAFQGFSGEPRGANRAVDLRQGKRR